MACDNQFHLHHHKADIFFRQTNVTESGHKVAWRDMPKQLYEYIVVCVVLNAIKSVNQCVNPFDWLLKSGRKLLIKLFHWIPLCIALQLIRGTYTFFLI